MTADQYLDYGNPFTEDEGHSEEEIEMSQSFKLYRQEPKGKEMLIYVGSKEECENFFSTMKRTFTNPVKYFWIDRMTMKEYDEWENSGEEFSPNDQLKTLFNDFKEIYSVKNLHVPVMGSFQKFDR